MTSSLVSIGCLPAGDTETIGWVTSHPATRVTFAPALTLERGQPVEIGSSRAADEAVLYLSGFYGVVLLRIRLWRMIAAGVRGVDRDPSNESDDGNPKGGPRGLAPCVNAGMVGTLGYLAGDDQRGLTGRAGATVVAVLGGPRDLHVAFAATGHPLLPADFPQSPSIGG